MSQSATDTQLYFQARGLNVPAPEALNAALAAVLETMPKALAGESVHELTAAEAEVLKSGGADLEEHAGPDPLAESVAEYAALVASSLSSAEVAKRMKVDPSRVRQLIANRRLYSFLEGHRRYVPRFQFRKNKLVPNIEQVNAALDPELHPIEVYRFYTRPDADLLDESGDSISPLAWLGSGRNPDPLIAIARQL